MRKTNFTSSIVIQLSEMRQIAGDADGHCIGRAPGLTLETGRDSRLVNNLSCCYYVVFSICNID